jgi:hypothetical protein
MRRSLGVLTATLLTLVSACEAAPEKVQLESNAESFFIEQDSLASVRYMGRDSLSDSAYVIRVVPEPDGQTVAIVFADPAQGISAGLALLEPREQRVHLVWPDSVGEVWWGADHRLVFQSTGSTGVHAIVDVHADSLEHLEAAHDTLPPAAMEAPRWESDARARATAYIDSIRSQPEGVPQQGQLRYTVTSFAPAPADSLVAFYVTARGTSGDRLNPSWYLLHLRSGTIAPVDSLTGRAEALLPGAAAWNEDGQFIYARGPVLYTARVSAATNSLQ